MPIPNPVLQAGVRLIAALLVNAGTGGDATKKAAKATAYLSVFSALSDLANGNDAAGLTALTAAIQSSTLDPGVGLAVQELISVAAQQLTALQAVAGASIVGQIDTALAQNLIGDFVTAFQVYVPTPAA